MSGEDGTRRFIKSRSHQAPLRRSIYFYPLFPFPSDPVAFKIVAASSESFNGIPRMIYSAPILLIGFQKKPRVLVALWEAEPRRFSRQPPGGDRASPACVAVGRRVQRPRAKVSQTRRPRPAFTLP